MGGPHQVPGYREQALTEHPPFLPQLKINFMNFMPPPAPRSIVSQGVDELLLYRELYRARLLLQTADSSLVYSCAVV